MAYWNLLTSHGLVLVCIAKNPNMTAREIGDVVGLTERTTHKVIVDLEGEGYIERVKTGRQNAYRIHPDAPIKDVVTDASIGELLSPLVWKRRKRQAKGEILTIPEYPSSIAVAATPLETAISELSSWLRKWASVFAMIFFMLCGVWGNSLLLRSTRPTRRSTQCFQAFSIWRIRYCFASSEKKRL